MEGTEQISTCPNCSCSYDTDLNTPLVPTCEHTICKKCIIGLLGQESTIFTCPICNKQCVAIEESEISLPRDLNIIELLEGRKIPQKSENKKEIASPGKNQYKKSLNNNNGNKNSSTIRINCLKASVKKSDIRKKFSRFGSIVNLNMDYRRAAHNAVTMKSVLLTYDSPESAIEASEKAQNIPDIKELFSFESHKNDINIVRKFKSAKQSDKTPGK